jgi:hypothetical protein
MKFYDRDYYPGNSKIEQQQEDDERYQEMLAEEQGEKAQELYDKFPEEPEAILSPQMVEIFGPLLNENYAATEEVNKFLYAMSLLEVKRQEVA